MPAPIAKILDLSESDLLAYDDGRQQQTKPAEWNHLCPLTPDCRDHTNRHEHRSFQRNTDSGTFYCWRCKYGGIFTEYQTAQIKTGAARSRQKLVERFALPATQSAGSSEWRAKLNGLQKLAGTPSAKYLASRSIPEAVAVAAKVRHSARWSGRPAVVFPLKRPSPERRVDDELVAAQGRYLEKLERFPDMNSQGDISLGVFATDGALTARPLVIVEAPIDALSLAACGYPAIALCGTAVREWVAQGVLAGHALLAFDADQAGDDAAEQWTKILHKYSCFVERVRPEGGKDWNEILQQQGGSERIEAQFRKHAPPVSVAPAPPAFMPEGVTADTFTPDCSDDELSAALAGGAVDSSSEIARACKILSAQNYSPDAIEATLADDPPPASPALQAERECYRLLYTGGSLQQLAAAVDRFVTLCDLGTGYTDPANPFADDACGELLEEIRWRGYLTKDMTDGQGQLPRNHIKKGIADALTRQASLRLVDYTPAAQEAA